MSSDKKYPSRFNPGVEIEVNKWLAEYMCGRKAASKKIDLPIRFWSHPVYKIPWAKEYQLQLIQANALLKIYTPEAISAALKTPQGKKIYSLGAKWLDDIIKIKQQEIDNKKIIKEEIKQERQINESPQTEIKYVDKRPDFNVGKNKNKLDKLRDYNG